MPRAAAHAFTNQERRKILNIIIDRNLYYSVKGNAMWRDIEHEFPRHTWQSLRQHFKMQLFPKISSPEFGLTQGQIENFRSAYQVSLYNPKRGRETPLPSLADLWSDDEDAVEVVAAIDAVGSSEETKNAEEVGESRTKETKTNSNIPSSVCEKPSTSTGGKPSTSTCEKPGPSQKLDSPINLDSSDSEVLSVFEDSDIKENYDSDETFIDLTQS